MREAGSQVKWVWKEKKRREERKKEGEGKGWKEMKGREG